MADDFAITKFMSKVDSLGGLARKNRFTVEITPPSTLATGVNAATINFLASGVGMPARTFGSTTYRSGGRFSLDVPYETTFEPVTLTMLNTNNHAPRRFWEDWFNHIQSINNDTSPKKNYYMQYYKKFIGTILISHFNDIHGEADSRNSMYGVTLHEAWPKTLGAIELGWENSEFTDFTVEIAFSRWTSNAPARGSGGQRHGQGYGGRGSTTTNQDTRARFNPDLER